MDDQQNDNRPSIPTWVWIITIFAVILGLQLFLSGRFSGPEQITLQEMADYIRAGEVKQLTVSGDRLQIDVYKRQRYRHGRMQRSASTVD